MIHATLQGHWPQPLLLLCLLFLIAVPVAIKAVFHPESPCPLVFNYEGNEPEFDRWYGEVQLVSNDNLVGVVLNIRFDRATHLLVSWTGEVTSEDNIIYSIINLNERLEAKIPFHSRFMVKFNGTRGSPRIRTIRLNGRQICPPEVNVVNELQQKPKVTTDKNHRVVTKRPDPVFPDQYTTSYYQDFMTPTTPKHRPKATEKYTDTDDLGYNTNLNTKPSGGGNKNKQSSNSNISPNHPQTDYNNYDNGYNSGNTHVMRPSVNNHELDSDIDYNRPLAGNNYPSQNKPSNSHFSNTDDETLYRPTGQSGSKKTNYNNQPSNSNYNPPVNSQSNSQPSNTNKKKTNNYNNNFDEDSGYSSVGQPSNYDIDEKPKPVSNNNKKPSSTNNYNNYNDNDYNNQAPNYGAEEKPRPTSTNTNNKKKPSGNNNYNNNFNGDGSGTKYNPDDKAKPIDSLSFNSPNIVSRPSGSSLSSSSRPTHSEHGSTSQSTSRPYPNSQTNREDNRKPSNNNNGYDSGYNHGGSNTGYNNGYDNSNANSYDTGMAQPPHQPSGNNNNNYPYDNNAGEVDKTDNLNIDEVQPSKSDKTVIITSIHKNTYVFPAKEEEGFDSNNANENKYENSNGNRVTTPKNNNYEPNEKPSVIMKPTSNQNSNSNKQHNNNNANSNGGIKPTQTSKPHPNANRDESCGVISAEATASTEATPLVTNGQATARGQWPWHVALYKTDGINLTYICGGSLITKNIVVTAAHCVTKKPYDRPIDANTIVIYLGKYHLQQYSDDGGIQIKQVLEIVPYPTYNSSNYLGDIALLKMTSSAEYTNFVRPVCLWDSRVVELSTVVDKEGTVIGWGYDEHDKASEELKMAKMPVVSQETCIYSNRPFFSQFTSNKTFCAGFRNGTSVCNGDSGGGMVFPRGSSWHLRGIVSISVAQSGLRKCDTKHYVVFTDVAKYLDWISNYVQKNRG